MTVHATADASPLLRSDAGGIVTLTLNRPAARNALSEALIDALARELDRIAADPAVRVVMLTAAGPAFSAGHDLKEMTARPDGSRPRPGLFHRDHGPLLGRDGADGRACRSR